MNEIQLVKNGVGLNAAYNQDAEVLDKIGQGSLVHAKLRQPRNPLFHRKFFALLNLGFEYWEPEVEALNAAMPKAVEPEKNFDRFRKDILILAGYRHAVVNIKNEVRWEAESISFSSMDELEFMEVYKNVFSVIWRLVLSSKFENEREAENAIDAMMSFT